MGDKVALCHTGCNSLFLMSDNINVSPLSSQINNLAVRIAKECKLIYVKLGDTTQLNTDNAESLVKAVNSLKTNYNKQQKGYRNYSNLFIKYKIILVNVICYINYKITNNTSEYL